ncbi:MAG: ATP synthase F0 subunit B [Desulfobacterales bacterium]|jgi:F-type H+-transporting ATPase subunit b|nr:ATP synthase F0 subunit B [Desulfobacterales bacterium]
MKTPKRIFHFTLFLFFFISIFFYAGIVFASSGGEHHGGGWAATDTYRVLNFFVLAGVLFFLLRKPVSQFLGDRIKGIQDQLNELDEKKADAEKKIAECNRRLATLEAESEKIIAIYQKQGEDARQKILKEAEAAALKLEEQARRNIEQEFKKARLELEAEIFEKAIAMAEDKLKKNITAQDQDKLVGEYLDKVVIK